VGIIMQGKYSFDIDALNLEDLAQCCVSVCLGSNLAGRENISFGSSVAGCLWLSLISWVGN
jgi:hypothetical protein